VLGLDNNLLEAAMLNRACSPANIATAPYRSPAAGATTPLSLLTTAGSPLYTIKKLKTPPGSLKELVESDAEMARHLSGSAHQHAGAGLLLWMQKVYGDKAPEAWQQLAAENRDRHQRLERSLGAVHERRRRPGAELHHLSGLSRLLKSKKSNTWPQTLAKATIPAGGSGGAHREKQQTAGAGA
jgi:hypothetical protein